MLLLSLYRITQMSSPFYDLFVSCQKSKDYFIPVLNHNICHTPVSTDYKVQFLYFC